MTNVNHDHDPAPYDMFEVQGEEIAQTKRDLIDTQKELANAIGVISDRIDGVLARVRQLEKKQ